MPRSIASQRVGRRRVAGKSIAARHGLTNLQSPHQFPPGSYTFVVPKSGYWKFVIWGPGATFGAGGTDGGGSGGYCEITRALLSGQSASITVARSGSNSIVTLPDGTVVTAATGTLAGGGAATGGDVNLSGSAGGAAGGNNAGAAGLGTGGGAGGLGGGGGPGGAGAPANLPFRGGFGGSVGVSNGSGITPGGGASDGTVSARGGDGQVIAYLVRD